MFIFVNVYSWFSLGNLILGENRWFLIIFIWTKTNRKRILLVGWHIESISFYKVDEQWSFSNKITLINYHSFTCPFFCPSELLCACRGCSALQCKPLNYSLFTGVSFFMDETVFKLNEFLYFHCWNKDNCIIGCAVIRAVRSHDTPEPCSIIVDSL